LWVSFNWVAWRVLLTLFQQSYKGFKKNFFKISIDALVDSAPGCRLLSFLDAFSSYNQIMMHPRDECKTAFMTKLSC